MKKLKRKNQPFDFKSNISNLFLFFSILLIIVIALAIDLNKFNSKTEATFRRRNACDVKTTKTHDDIKICSNGEEKKLKSFGQVAKVTIKYDTNMNCIYVNNLFETKVGYVYTGSNNLIEAGDDVAGYDIICRKASWGIRDFWYKPCTANGC